MPRIPDLRRIPCVFLSALWLVAQPLAAFDWGAVTDDFLLRPSDPPSTVPIQLTSETTLFAPYRIVSTDDRFVFVDLAGETPTPKTRDLNTMTLIGTTGIGRVTFVSFENGVGKYKRPVQGQFGDAVTVFRGIFPCDKVAVPEFLPNETLPAGVLISAYRLFTLVMGPQAGDLYYGNSRILTSEPGVRPPTLEMALELTSLGKKFYLVKVGLEQRDVLGLLFKSGKEWEFLFR